MDVLHIERLLYYRRCLFLVLELDVSQSLISHLWVLRYMYITWKLQVVQGHSAYQKTPLLSETFLVWFRVAWEIWLESYVPRLASVIPSQHCVQILQTCTYIAIWCTTIYDNKTHVTFDCILHTKQWGLLTTMRRFIRKKLASYTTCWSVFPINHVRWY